MVAIVGEEWACAVEDGLHNKKSCADGNVDAFLGALSEQDRQAVWQSFEYGRGKDPRAATHYDTICRGCGSDTKKKQALHAFMVASRDAKSNLYMEETVSGMHTNTQREMQALCDQGDAPEDDDRMQKMVQLADQISTCSRGANVKVLDRIEKMLTVANAMKSHLQCECLSAKPSMKAEYTKLAHSLSVIATKLTKALKMKNAGPSMNA